MKNENFERTAVLAIPPSTVLLSFLLGQALRKSEMVKRLWVHLAISAFCMPRHNASLDNQACNHATSISFVSTSQGRIGHFKTQERGNIRHSRGTFSAWLEVSDPPPDLTLHPPLDIVCKCCWGYEIGISGHKLVVVSDPPLKWTLPGCFFFSCSGVRFFVLLKSSRESWHDCTKLKIF